MPSTLYKRTDKALLPRLVVDVMFGTTPKQTNVQSALSRWEQSGKCFSIWGRAVDALVNFRQSDSFTTILTDRYLYRYPEFYEAGLKGERRVASVRGSRTTRSKKNAPIRVPSSPIQRLPCS